MTYKEITEYIFVENKNLNADIAFAFGTWNAYKESCRKAAELYKQGRVQKIIVSGGVNPKSGLAEGVLMAEEMQKLGVPKKDVLIENRASNTLENVLFTREILDRRIGLGKIKVIVVVVKNIHARRALMTLKKHMPSGIELKSAPYASDYYENVTKENWHKTESGRTLVMHELEKIQKYLTKGDISEL
ncbi:MAG TPA: YdcF family protein [Candidatus Paceibacterota bacterium]